MIERDEERARLTRFFAGRSDGRGRIGVISGAAGSGKTALLNHVSEHVMSSGVQLLSAVAAPSEQAFPYAVLEQLLQGLPPLADGLPPLLFPLPSEHGPHPGEPDPQVPLAILRGFHRILAELTAQQPLLIAIDDVQFADPQSLTCLAYAVRRLPANRPALLVACGGRSGGTPAAVRELRHQLDRCNIRLGPLSEQGVNRLLADVFGTVDADRLTPAFHAATGGNPLLLHGYLDDTPRPAPGTGGRTALTPKAGEMFRQAALACVHRAGEDSVSTARGIAVLGAAEAVPLLCGLVGLEELITRQAIAALAEAGILNASGTAFRHEAVREAVLEDLPAESAAQLRWRAARLLYEDGASPTAVAHQLIDHEPPAPHEEWVPEVLREAARWALTDDEVAFATRCLQTAERRCPDDQQRLAIRAELAEILWRVKPSASAQQLQSLAAPARAGLLPPSQTLQLALGMLWNGQMDDAAAAIRQVNEVMAKEPDAQLGSQLQAARVLLTTTYPGTLGKVKEWPGQEHSGRITTAAAMPLKALSALQAALRQEPEDAVAEQAEQVLRSTRLTDLSRQVLKTALLALVYTERLGPATLWCDRLLAEADARNAPSWLAMFNAVRAQIAYRRGHLTKAVECAEQALEQLPANGWGVGIGMPLATLVEARTAMGHHDTAAELLESPVPEAMYATRYGAHYLYARGRHQLATGRHHAAMTDLAACGERMRAWGMDSAALAPWRLGMAETWLALDNHDKAAEWAKDQLARAPESQPRIRGMARRLLASTLPPAERPKLLGQAITALQSGGDCYEMARALADLGQAHKQLGEVAKGRLLVRRAWRMAEGCGAEELYRSLQPTSVRGGSSEAAGESASAGRADSAAVASLTDAERRVASLAVYGYTNREIAAKLFITISTVEQHLTRVYRKINISHRQDLPVSLDSDVAHSA
ncbi:helix-turn-helix transcriptional regulator [Streptantibioticus rubrisoli]|uniref:AAA family ATPase n=1 Tax=Streptantibioticus rubrisoli TaxID=1387313 RepID=A0ABT1PCX9_9ACTN|nr:helix-turn-helix transcriptional regulator [Streptantibioticus rubrisoli]MCQ4043227.1 AAA family ATPase [Streptantibioticus rubrisoli]